MKQPCSKKMVRFCASSCRRVCESSVWEGVRKLAGAYDFANDSRHGMCFLVLFFNICRWFDCFETFGWQLPPGGLHMQFRISYSIGRKDSWHHNGVSKLPNFYIDAPVCQSFFGFGDWRLLFVFVAFSHMFGSRSMFFRFQSCRLCWSCLRYHRLQGDRQKVVWTKFQVKSPSGSHFDMWNPFQIPMFDG